MASLIHIQQPQSGEALHPIYCSSINGQSTLSVGFGVGPTGGTGIAIASNQTNSIITQFIFNGQYSPQNVASANIWYHYSSGVLGTCTITVTDVTQAIVYFSGVFDNFANTENVAVLSAVTPLPTTTSLLYLNYTTTSSFNHPSDAIKAFNMNF